MALKFNKTDGLVLTHIEKYMFLTIGQCSNIFHKGKNKKYELARRQLNKLCEMNELKRYKDIFASEYFYTLKNNNKNVSFHRYILMNLYSEIYGMCDSIDYFEPEEYWKTSEKKRFCDGHIIFTVNKGSEKEYKKAFFIEIDKYNKTKLEKYEEIYKEGIVQEWYKNNIGNEYFPDVLIINQGIIKDKIVGKYSVVFIDYEFNNLLSKVIM